MFPGPPSLFLMGSKPNYSLLRRGCLLSSKGRHVLTRAWSILLSCCNSFVLSSGRCVDISLLHFVFCDSHCLNLCQASAAIHEKFPDSPLFSRMSIFKLSQASEFILSRPRLPSSFYSGLMLGKKLRLSFRQIPRLR
jgi:hypothetical protein